MKYDIYFLFALVAIGVLTKKLSAKGWVAVMFFVASLIAYNWMRG